MIASVAAVAQIIHAVDTLAALGTVVTTCAVKAALALGADLIIGTVLTLFTAGNTDDRAFRAAVSAVADLIHTVFAQQTLRAVIALAADAVKAGIAFNAHLQLRAV